MRKSRIKSYHKPTNDDQPTWMHRLFSDTKKPKRTRKKVNRKKQAYKGNPMKKIVPPAVWKKRLYSMAIIGSSASAVGLLCFHPFFRITDVHVSGLSQISAPEFESSALGILDYRRYFIFPANNIFFADVTEVRDILKEKYPIQRIVVQKQFPHTLDIAVEEKISQLIYDNGTMYSYIDLEGKVVEDIAKVHEEEWNIITEQIVSTSTEGTVSTTIKEVSRTHIPNTATLVEQHGQDIPIVYDTRHQEYTDRPVLQSQTIERLVFWYSLLEKRGNYHVSYIIVDNELGDATFVIDDSWQLLVKLEEPERQFDMLELITKDNIDEQNVSYINVRYGERVYWQ